MRISEVKLRRCGGSSEFVRGITNLFGRNIMVEVGPGFIAKMIKERMTSEVFWLVDNELVENHCESVILSLKNPELSLLYCLRVEGANLEKHLHVIYEKGAWATLVKFIKHAPLPRGMILDIQSKLVQHECYKYLLEVYTNVPEADLKTIKTLFLVQESPRVLLSFALIAKCYDLNGITKRLED